MKHLAIFKKETAEKILTGDKTLDCRFSRLKKAPFLQISKGDLVYIKVSGEEIIGQFRVKKVIFIDGVTEEDIRDLEGRCKRDISEDQSYWKEIKDYRFASLIFIGDCIRFITSPVKIPKKDSRGWVVLM